MIIMIKGRAQAMEKLINSIRKNNLNYEADTDAYSIENESIYIQFQDRETVSYRANNNLTKIKQDKTETNTWIRIWIDNNLVFKGNFPKYVARQKAIDFLVSEA